MNAARRFIHSVIVPVAVAAIALTAVAGSFGQVTTNSSPEDAREEAKLHRTQLPFAKGVLDSVDLLRHQLKLKIKDDLRTFTYTADTYIFRGKEKITPDGLKPGETIALRVYTDKEGQVLVQRIKAYGIAQPTPAEPAAGTEPAK
ncbi:MAG TPA: hypothetical protein VL486_13905 [Verrucomicrobiae bacterium]|nr:hypothetical protein [Verrucomicrobiae bacterium]